MGSEPAVFSAGTVNADFVLRIGTPLERNASLIAQRLLRTSGGRAANVAVMARRLGTDARLYGCVGADELAEQALAGPRREGVGIAMVRRVSGETGLAMIAVAPRGEKTMILAPGANDSFSEADGERLGTELHDAQDGSVLVVDSELLPASLAPALEAARDAGRPTVLDPTRPDRVTDRLLELSDHLTPNHDEAGRIAGVEVESPADARRAATRIRERGPRHVHVRLPRGGCLTLWPEGGALLHAPADVEVVDTTGAGDAFVGTLATEIVARRPLLEAVRRAVAAASCAVTVLGPQESYPGRTALEAMASRVRVETHPKEAG